MKRFAWLLWCTLAAAWTSSDYLAVLTLWDPAVPYTTVTNEEICYYHPVTSSCAIQGINTLLGLSITDVATWTPTTADCGSMLDKEILYFEEVFGSLFAGVTFFTDTTTYPDKPLRSKFDLMARVWILRYGHFALATAADWQAFITFLKTVTDWSKTSIDTTAKTFSFDGTSVPLPTALGNLCATTATHENDCSVLEAWV